ncbi:hypothetical protein ZEAMMB73_Zm00001d025973 [Zea mays]|uniref:Uncharacterized protein n=1 Tax=Zea mays TaxID=4577 RepID=A0A1D6JBB6_MAIZE|nr:hypothetical protein ZEAMMB73_Zm00001d025973 [Zea mays]
MDIGFRICASIISSCQLGRRHVYFHSCAPILASSIVSFWCTADFVCVKCEHPLLEPPWRSAIERHDSSSPSDASRLFDEMCEKQNRDINGVFMCLIHFKKNIAR